jgi:outer membrane protein
MQTRPDVVVRAALVALVMAAVPASGFGQATPAPAQTPPAPAPTATVPAQPVPPAPTPAQGVQPAPNAPASQAAPIQEQRGGGAVRRLTIDEAVQVALEQNLDVQVAKIDPQLQQLTVDQAKSVWLPQLASNIQFRSSSTEPNSALSGAIDALTNRSFFGSATVDQVLPTGTSYSIGMDATRATTNDIFSNFDPRLASSLSFSLTQPLLRGFKIDGSRAQYLIQKKNQEITDVQLQQQIIATSRAVRLAYWTLVGARYNLGVAQASLDISRQTLRDNRTRVEVGTMAPIDVVGAEAEVSRNEEFAIVAAAQIDEAEDALRALLYDPKQPEFWTLDIDLADAPQLPQTQTDVDVEGAIKNALAKRTDLVTLRKQLEAAQINLRFTGDQTKPVVNALVDYGLNAQGGLEVTERGPRDPNNPLFPGEPIATVSRGFGTVLGDLFGFDFPTWSVGAQVIIPLGNSSQKVAHARAKLAYSQQELSLRNSELGVATQVRTVARSVNTNRRRVESTTAARVFSERQLDAARKKFAVGLAQSIDVLIAQRDLANARFNELSSIIDYVKSLVELQAVQEGGNGGGLAQGVTGGAGNVGGR